MARNGNGIYSLPASSWNPAVSGGTIESTAANTTLNDIAAALTQSVSKDGQTPMTGQLNMANNKIINLTDGSAATDAMTYGQGAKLTGNNTFVGNQTITGNLSVSGTASVSGALTAGPLTINGSTSLSGSVTVTGPVIFTGDLTLTSTLATSSTAGPTLALNRVVASGSVDGKLGKIAFNGSDAAGNLTEYASINGVIVDPTNGSEDGALEFDTVIAGTKATRWRLWGGLYANGLGEQGQGTVNAVIYYENNVRVLGIPQVRLFTHTTYMAVGSAMTVGSTLPAITEGAELLVASLTPSVANSTFIFTYTGQFSNSTTVNAGVGLFMVGSTVMLGGTPFGSNTADFPKTVTFQHSRVNATASTQTFTIRAGPSSGTLYVNGIGTGPLQLYNGANKGVLKVEEILP